MAAPNSMQIHIEALDAGQGYLLRGKMFVDSSLTEINEHHATEAALRTRLGTGFDIWAAQVDAE